MSFIVSSVAYNSLFVTRMMLTPSWNGPMQLSTPFRPFCVFPRSDVPAAPWSLWWDVFFQVSEWRLQMAARHGIHGRRTLSTDSPFCKVSNHVSGEVNHLITHKTWKSHFQQTWFGTSFSSIDWKNLQLKLRRTCWIRFDQIQKQWLNFTFLDPLSFSRVIKCHPIWGDQSWCKFMIALWYFPCNASMRGIVWKVGVGNNMTFSHKEVVTRIGYCRWIGLHSYPLFKPRL